MLAAIFELSGQRWSPIPPTPKFRPLRRRNTWVMDAIFFSDILANNENSKDWRKFDQWTSPRVLTVCSLV